LGGDRDGQYSIRVNDRWRICFRWVFEEDPAGKDLLLTPGDAVDVEIVDYH
jgi:proteic killer suppression protein